MQKMGFRFLSKTRYSHFSQKYDFFAKNAKGRKIIQRGMRFLNLTFNFFITPKKPNF